MAAGLGWCGERFGNCHAAEGVALAGAIPRPVDELVEEAEADLEPTSPYADHPLAAVLRQAQDRYKRMQREINDYTATLIRRERLQGQLQPYQYISAKVRHRQISADGSQIPFAVYLRYLAAHKGREVLYVEGENDGELLATRGGSGSLSNFTVSLEPTSERAMAESLYPITEIGMLNFSRRLLLEGTARMRADKWPDKWEVRYYKEAKINGRPCTCVETRRLARHDEDRLHTLQVFIDKEWHVPTRYALYRWPRDGNGDPQLEQECTYVDLKLNVGLGDEDFERANPRYRFYTPKENRRADAEPLPK
jgi:hypothetical protein